MPIVKKAKSRILAPASALSDSQLDEVTRLLNLAIHEIVFACHHAEDDQLDESSNCLMTAGLNIEQAATIICTAAEQSAAA